MAETQLSDEDVAALVLAKGGVETEHGTQMGKRFERLCELGYVKEATLTANGVAWRLSSRGAEIAYADDGDHPD
jgi:hypothetical protein